METNLSITNNKVKLISHSTYYNPELFTDLDSNLNTNTSTETSKIINLEQMVAFCARVSNPSNQMVSLSLDNSKLINYLISNNHWSPFEMVSICLEINTTRDIARQILRHRSFSFQEFSQRYAIADLGYEVREARIQDNKNRQNSIDTNDSELKTQWEQIQKEIHEKTSNAYQWAITNGIAKEQARVVLPEGNTLSKLYVNGTLRSWIHYIQLRTGNGTQKEHKEIAILCAMAIKPIFPSIVNFISK
jgi:thymidylate synthase (FAD)